MHGPTRESFPATPASMSTNSMASSLHRPLSPAQRQPNDTTSSALSRRARMRAAPFVCAALGCGQPSEEVALRKVMSTANWAPWSIGSPDATTFGKGSWISTSTVIKDFDQVANRKAVAKRRNKSVGTRQFCKPDFFFCTMRMRWMSVKSTPTTKVPSPRAALKARLHPTQPRGAGLAEHATLFCRMKLQMTAPVTTERCPVTDRR